MVWNLSAAMSAVTGKVAVDATLLADLKSQIAALHEAFAVIEFDLTGRILSANDNFLRAMGYRLEEVRGQHHSLFVTPAMRASEEYRRFWEKLGRGESDTGQSLRVAKGGREVWIQASYHPILDAAGKPCKVVKYATDVTAQMLVTRQMQTAVGQSEEVLKSAVAGDLTRRVDTAQTSGDVRKMADVINGLLGTVEHVFADVRQIVLTASQGNLTCRVDVSGKSGDLRKMAEAVNHLIGSMAEIVTNVKGASSEVLRGAEEISQGTGNLSQRTEQQSASLEQTASSMEEMTSTVKQNADNAGQANQLATAARDQAEKGGTVVGDAVNAMAKINEASTKIADIIGVIDEIAFQTNLLALNAAVEAARAGEQGRGFAVVASEVRSLAGRSATAAKEIKELIQDSVRKVEDGSRLVTQSGQTLQQIVTSVKKVSDIVAEIAAASREQSGGIEQVNKAVTQMDEMTQQNAALVEEATAASQSVAVQARQLTKMMERYSAGNSAARLTESKPAPARTQTPQTPSGVERRSGSRPWSSGVPSAGTRAPAAPARTPSNADAGDADWVEF